jgi:HAMP domain-containing protein
VFLLVNVKDGLEGHAQEVILQDVAGRIPDFIGRTTGNAVAEILVIDTVNQAAGAFQGLQDLADRDLGRLAG